MYINVSMIHSCTTMRLAGCMVSLLFLSALFFLPAACSNRTTDLPPVPHSKDSSASVWRAPDTSKIPHNEYGELVRYGLSLVANTSFYYGPGGKISNQANGMNCQNCHLDGGRKPWGNNFGIVYSGYPRFRERRGAIESIPQRVNDCFERSMNGKPIDSNSREMKAFFAWFNWLGKDVVKGTKPKGTVLEALPYPEFAADSAKGEKIFTAYCLICHGPQGEGKLKTDSPGYTYPPLWGEHSYNTAAGMFRLSRLAAFVKNNMPFGTTHEHPILTDEEAWNVAAFINSKPRPLKTFAKDYPNISLKPVDHPFGPWADSFPARQHKYGPFKPMVKKPAKP